MSTDFRPTGTRTLETSPAQNDIAGLRAIRAGAGMSYKFGRDAETQTTLGTVDRAVGSFTALGADYETDLLDVVNGHAAVAVGANVAVELLDTATGHSATAEGEAFEVSAGGSEPLGVDYETSITGGGVSADTLRDVISGVSTGDGQNRVFHYGATLAYEEAGVIVYGGAAGTTLIDAGDYDADGDDVIFDTAPALDDIIHIYRKALGTPVYTAQRVPATPAGSTAIEVLVVKTDTPETLTLTTDYLITNGGLTITLTAAGIDKAVTGKTVSLFYKATNNKFPTVADAKRRLGCSADGVFSVEVEGVPAELTTDYTVVGAVDGVGGYVQFVAGHVPAAGSSHTVELIRTFTNDTWLLTGPCTQHLGASAAAGQPVVKVSTVLKTDGVDYDYNANDKTVIFKAGKIPAGAATITVKDVWSNDKWLLTGAPVTGAGSSVAATFVVEDNGAPVDAGDYTLVAGVSVVFDTPPTAGHTIEAFSKQTNNRFTVTGPRTAADAHNSAAELVAVFVDPVGAGPNAEKVLTQDYTVDVGTGGIVTMGSGDIPGAGDVVTLFWRKLNDKYPHGGGPDSANETISVVVDSVEMVEGAGDDYVVSGDSIVFNAGSIPLADLDLDSSIVSAAYAVVIAGGELWLDTHRVNFPAWDYLVINGTPVVEVM